ncbi:MULTISPECIES: sensor histidine kinase [unclassified Coleofasciculus]|uniref:sensor histidine kinase n=1 Tax=unclassified Coleofasciculus TaxID=2692782 RepID=UPI00187F3EB9|nr:MULTISPECIES: response regulator [unclassified Coleofasciculus]MBE9128261.1 hybrid sensor histidine kinase/response regulator [Coleofasciculus sp. LEGE 07081]MBE9151303.1 hybrid sensor histidine kinase/response regulator [Coleofasciculus sp. LEGE 07092]
MAKILVIDDDLTVQLVLKNLLQSQGHEVTIAQNGEEGLYKAKVLHPELIICDWVMPRLNGVEVCRRIKADPQLATTFLILLTMRDQVTDRVEGLDAGADEFISKPIKTEELLARVRAGLRSCQLTQQLNQALLTLQANQVQLVQSEKMVSLWQLVAGMAHELNNPVTFIYSNLSYVEHYTQDLLELLHLYQTLTPNPSPEVTEKLEETDLNFLVDDLPKILLSMRRGAERIQKIVLSLQDFSRQNRSGLQLVNLHRELENTLLILEHRLQSCNGELGIKVLTDYGDLPLVECYPSQLNQVFINIFNNAIEAIEADPNTIFGQISIRTQALDSDRVVIRIANNGPEIPPKVKARIFDPFFTTKPVGTGTGLGLAISYQIVVEQHKGSLKCLSEAEWGTEFWIELPRLLNVSMLSSQEVVQSFK